MMVSQTCIPYQLTSTLTSPNCHQLSHSITASRVFLGSTMSQHTRRGTPDRLQPCNHPMPPHDPRHMCRLHPHLMQKAMTAPLLPTPCKTAASHRPSSHSHHPSLRTCSLASTIHRLCSHTPQPTMATILPACARTHTHTHSCCLFSTSYFPCRWCTLPGHCGSLMPVLLPLLLLLPVVQCHHFPRAAWPAVAEGLTARHPTAARTTTQPSD